MARPPIDLERKVRDILAHLEDLPPEAAAPITHYRRSVADAWNMRLYFERGVARAGTYEAVAERHMQRLDCLILMSVLQAFERFLKECAAVCVDNVAEFVLDRRFDEFPVKGGNIATHFAGGTLGLALCESSTWLDCEDVNARFRKTLADPFQPGNFQVFPGPAPNYATMSILWQLRHSIVHNVGVITRSDALKLKLQSREPVEAPGLLAPTRDDVRYVKRFIDESAEDINTRVGQRLAALLTTLRAHHAAEFDPQVRADRLSNSFFQTLTVAGAVGVVTPV